MNKGIQLQSLLFGDQEAVNELAEKECSRILVYSDSHGAFPVVQKIIEERGHSYDAMIFCGDGISDISACFTRAVVNNDFAQKIPPVISFVRGNCDPDEFAFKNMKRLSDSSAPFYISVQAPLSQTLCASGINIFSAHGHKYSFDFGIEDALNVSRTFNADIIVYGHSHIHDAHRAGNILILNPGSCAKPRGGQKATFAEIVIDKKNKSVDYSFIDVN